MNWKRHIIEAATLIVAAVLCALTANALASRERKLTVAPVERVAAPLPSQRALSVAPAPPAASQSTTTPVPVTTTVDAESGGARPKAANTTTVAPHPATDSRQPATPQTPNLAVAKELRPHPDKPFLEIGYADVSALHNHGALFLDARRTSIYEQGHIAGARPFSVWESDIDEKVNKLFAERGDPREQEKPIVAYCSGGDCEDSHNLAQKLWGIQFNNVYVYKDGFPDWQKHGGAVRVGAEP